jgi:hypothetical protein
MITLTPKEKAKELVNTFLRTYKVSLYPPFTKASDEAKECALIAVDEIIKEFENIFSIFTDKNSPRLIYWQQVKQEIEKL